MALIDDVKKFLEHEHEFLLKPAHEEATTTRDSHPTNSLEYDMWDGWVGYFDHLIAQNRTMKDWDAAQFQSILQAEGKAIAELEGLIDGLLADASLGPTERRHIGHLKILLTIEREATDLMRAAAAAT